MARILCVDPDVSRDRGLEAGLRSTGHTAICASTLREGAQALRDGAFGLLVVASRLPDGRGLDLLRTLRRERAEIPVIVTTDPTELESGMEALRQGAIACLMRPLRAEALRVAVANVLGVEGSAPEPPADPAAVAVPCATPALVGESRALRHALEIIRAVAPTSETVLIEGESGTGKELIARALHEESRRAGRPFVAVNCAAMPEGLIESTLFGHERGAFTGATTRFIGAFERADGGSLLLDEISELRLDLQAKLLRAIQQKQFERVGGSRPIRVDVRIIATTNRDLKAAVAAGRFRRDLFYRLNVFPVRVPPLRERLEDVPLLVRHFVDEYARDLGIEPPEVEPQTLRALSDRFWPGNVRELQHAVVRAVVLKRGGPLEFADFRLEEAGRPGPEAPAGGPGVAPEPLPEWGTLNLRELERCAIERALSRTGGNRARRPAARHQRPHPAQQGQRPRPAGGDARGRAERSAAGSGSLFRRGRERRRRRERGRRRLTPQPALQSIDQKPVRHCSRSPRRVSAGRHTPCTAEPRSGGTMIKALFGPSTSPYALRQALDASMQRHREIALRVAGALTSSTQGSGEGGASGAAASGGDLVQDMAALADTQIRYEAEARLLHTAYQRLRSAIGKNG